MSEPIVYIDCSEVREGKLEELKAAIQALAELVEANEPRLLAYRAFFSEDGSRMSVLHIHPDTVSLELHMKVVGPVLPRFADLLRLQRIDLYGRPSDALVEQMRQKAQLLGTGMVQVHDLQAGFARFRIGVSA